MIELEEGNIYARADGLLTGRLKKVQPAVNHFYDPKHHIYYNQYGGSSLPDYNIISPKELPSVKPGNIRDEVRNFKRELTAVIDDYKEVYGYQLTTNDIVGVLESLKAAVLKIQEEDE